MFSKSLEKFSLFQDTNFCLLDNFYKTLIHKLPRESVPEIKNRDFVHAENFEMTLKMDNLIGLYCLTKIGILYILSPKSAYILRHYN